MGTGKLARAALVAAGSLAALACVGWLGLRVEPAPPRPHFGGTPEPGGIPLPPGLPEPVRRYFRAAAGGEVAATETAVVWGRGELDLNGLRFPARFEAYYDVPGRAFRRDMELTWFGMAVFTGRDMFVGGRGVLRITGLLGLVDLAYEGEKFDQGANLAMWGELLAYAPAALLLDPRVRWEPIDANAARLVLPLGEGEDSLRADFDPKTGLMTQMSGMRYRGEEGQKTLWRGEASSWRTERGRAAPYRLTATWEDQARPYVVLDLEGVAYDSDVSGKVFGDDG